jgi:hypothetical protein
MGRRVEEKEVCSGQHWKSKYADVTYVVYGGGTLGRVEMYDTTDIWDCKQVYKEELREHFILIKDTSIIRE